MDYIKVLYEFSSKDVTRYHLTAIFFDGEYWVSIDGHRMLVVSKSLIPMAGEAGKLYEGKEFSLGVLKPMEGNYPNWKSLVPSSEKVQFTFKQVLPSWFSQMKVKRKQSVPMLGLTQDGQWTTKKALINFNLALLAPLCDGESDVRLHVTCGLSPMLIEQAVKAPEWFAIIMPMRVGDHPCEVLKTPSEKKLEVIK